MNIAGRYLSLAQGIAEAALLAPLRSKYKLQLNLQELANQAKEELRERGVSLTPSNLRNTADDIAGRIATQYDDIVGTVQTRWNPTLKEYEEYIIPDPRKFFVR
jgi:hypothetical protein